MKPENGSCVHCHHEAAELQAMPPIDHPQYAAIVEIQRIKGEVYKLRLTLGLHPEDPDKFRRERWFITVAKLFALDLAIDALLALPADVASSPEGSASVENLTGEKSLLDWLHGRRIVASEKRKTYGGREDSFGLTEWNRADAEELLIAEVIREALSGSAGTQPLTSEETPEPEPCRCKVPASNLPQWFDSLSTSDLHAVSELALEAMERRPGAEYEWGVADKFAEAIGRR